MRKYKVEDFVKLENEYSFKRETVGSFGEVLYLPMPHCQVILYVVISQGIMMFERSLGRTKVTNDYDEFDKCRNYMLEDYMKAKRLVDQLEFYNVISKVEE